MNAWINTFPTYKHSRSFNTNILVCCICTVYPAPFTIRNWLAVLFCGFEMFYPKIFITNFESTLPVSYFIFLPFFVTPNSVHANQIVEMENLLWLLLIQTLTTRCVCVYRTNWNFMSIHYDSIRFNSNKIILKVMNSFVLFWSVL